MPGNHVKTLFIALSMLCCVFVVGVGVAAQKKQTYPEPEISYQPTFPPLGVYSVPGVCQPIHDDSAAMVTLRDGEKLNSAGNRLRALSGGEGGIIEVPWNVNTLQCDTLRTVRNRHMDKVTLRGVPGPKGELPRFYCRAEKLGGTIPKGKGGGVFWNPSDNGDILMESLHIDGYGNFLRVGGDHKVVVRNSYLHHSTNNGISKSKDGVAANISGAEYQFCGNEFAYSGQGNTKHTFYITSSWKVGAEIGVTLVDNVLHSCNWSSCFKSVADRNTLINNTFYKTLETDPSFKTGYSQMLIDIGACAQNEIRGNYLHVWRPEPRGYAGGIMIGIRNRKGNFGCHRPLGYTKNAQKEVVPDMNSPFWKPEYWKSLGGEKVLKTVITGNTFEGSGAGGWSSNPIIDWGTYPNRVLRQFGPACLLPTPKLWYERHRSYASDNRYINIPQQRWYRSTPPDHFDEDKCGPMSLPDRREFELIEATSGERHIENSSAASQPRPRAR